MYIVHCKQYAVYTVHLTVYTVYCFRALVFNYIGCSASDKTDKNLNPQIVLVYDVILLYSN